MRKIPLEERKALGALLERQSQAEVMARIPQFGEAETGCFTAPPETAPESLGVLMFNMERGVHLAEIQDFLRDCPDIRPLAPDIWPVLKPQTSGPQPGHPAPACVQRTGQGPMYPLPLPPSWLRPIYTPPPPSS